LKGIGTASRLLLGSGQAKIRSGDKISVKKPPKIGSLNRRQLVSPIRYPF
jgi:hypothetical protein